MTDESSFDDLHTEAVESKMVIYCSFCGKSQHEARKIIAAQTTFICDECIIICDDILLDDFFPGRIVVRIRVPTNSQIDDALHEVISKSVSEIYPDIDFKYETKIFDTGKNLDSPENCAVYSFAKIYGDTTDKKLLIEEYENIKIQLSNAVLKLSVMTEKFLTENEKYKKVQEDLLYLKSEYLEFLRNKITKENEVSELRAVMFLDISGFSQFEIIYKRKILDMLRGIAPPLIEKNGAQEINMWGDAIVANFTDPNIAIECAVKFLRHLSVERLEARIGMAWGKIRISFNEATRRPDVDGPIVDLAARLEPMAPLGGVLLSEQFGGLDINPSIGTLTPIKMPVKKAFADYQEGDEINLYLLKTNMN